MRALSGEDGFAPANLPATVVRLFLAFAGAAVFLILGLARNLSFLGDEWDYIVLRRLTFESLLRPHNEHLAALHIFVYRLMVETIGTGSYLPFLAVLMVAHVVTAAGVLVLLGGVLPPAGALAAAVLLLFLGSGFDNLVWAFQIGFVGSTAFGVWALVAHRRPLASAFLLTAALWTQSVGLFFVLPVAILSRRRIWLAIPLGSYAAWFLLVGRNFVPVPSSGPYVAYALTGIGSAFGGVTGVGQILGLGAAAIAIAFVAGGFLRRGMVDAYPLAGIAGLASEFAILAVGRAHFGLDQAEAPRYIYVAAPFIFMLLPAFRRVPRVVWVTVFAFALVANVLMLPRGVAIYEAFLHYDRTLSIDEKVAVFR